MYTQHQPRLIIEVLVFTAEDQLCREVAFNWFSKKMPVVTLEAIPGVLPEVSSLACSDVQLVMEGPSRWFVQPMSLFEQGCKIIVLHGLNHCCTQV